MQQHTRGGGFLRLAGFELVDAYGRPLTMAADGVITGPKGYWGRAGEDGAVTFPDGSLRGKLFENGSVVDAAGTALAEISADGAARVGPFDLRFNEEGWIVGGDAEQTIRLTTPLPEVRRLAMLVFILTQLRPRKTD